MRGLCSMVGCQNENIFRNEVGEGDRFTKSGQVAGSSYKDEFSHFCIDFTDFFN